MEDAKSQTTRWVRIELTSSWLRLQLMDAAHPSGAEGGFGVRRLSRGRPTHWGRAMHESQLKTGGMAGLLVLARESLPRWQVTLSHPASNGRPEALVSGFESG
jgi:hypothetical protein